MIAGLAQQVGDIHPFLIAFLIISLHYLQYTIILLIKELLETGFLI